MARIVVIDDEPIVAEACAAILRRAGFEVAVANDGETGLELIRDLLPAAVVTDIRLPGISGHEVISMLKAQPATARIPVLLMSGHGSPTENECAAFLSKPFVISEFLATVQKLAAQNPTGG